LAAVWDRLQPTGSIDLHIDSLRFQRSGANGPREWQVEGYVELADVALPGVANVDRLSGTLIGSGRIVDRLGGTRLAGTLALSSLDLFGQRIEHAESGWYYARVADGEGVLALESFRGRIHDGSVSGKVKLTFDPNRTNYDLAATVHGMRIASLINGGGTSPSGDRDAIEPKGRADGHLYLSGVVGDPSQKRGGGRVEITGGCISRFPILLAILHVLNLSIPTGDVFDDARADFYVVGNRVQLKDIVLRDNALALVGSGSLTLPDRGVDLDLVHVGPLGRARVPLLTEFVEGASRELVELHVTGPISQPTVRVRPLPTISKELKRLFQKKKSKKTQAEPS
jgi:hypothetical protein